jgi:hypothetical protein
MHTQASIHVKLEVKLLEDYKNEQIRNKQQVLLGFLGGVIAFFVLFFSKFSTGHRLYLLDS